MLVALLTTARKATVSAVVAFLSPPTALIVSDQPLTWRVVFASLLVGLIAGLTTYETGNTEKYEPTGRHHAGEEQT